MPPGSRVLRPSSPRHRFTSGAASNEHQPAAGTSPQPRGFTPRPCQRSNLAQRRSDQALTTRCSPCHALLIPTASATREARREHRPGPTKTTRDARPRPREAPVALACQPAHCRRQPAAAGRWTPQALCDGVVAQPRVGIGQVRRWTSAASQRGRAHSLLWSTRCSSVHLRPHHITTTPTATAHLPSRAIPNSG